MKKIIFSAAIAFTLVVSSLAFTLATGWTIGKDYAVKFKDSKASGGFEKMSGTIVFDEKNPSAAKFDISIEVASINTGIGLKNKHAKSDKWFDAEKFPLIKFTSASVTKKGDGYEATGELELHGVKKPLTIPFTFKENGGNGVFNGSFKVNRNEFGIGKLNEKDPDITSLEVTVPVTAKK